MALYDKKEKWLKGDEKEVAYHLSQYEKPKAYTLELGRIAEERRLFQPGGTYVDACCGAGAVTAYFRTAAPRSHFIGIDLNPQYLEIAQSKCPEITYLMGNIEEGFAANLTTKVDGVLCLQTLSWIDGYETALRNFASASPQWILATSLFYDGPVDADITTTDYSRQVNGVSGRRSSYNIYSLERLAQFSETLGYRLDETIPFEFPFDLPRPAERGMGTYTVNTQNAGRLQISGPLLMPWYTIILRKR